MMQHLAPGQFGKSIHKNLHGQFMAICVESRTKKKIIL